ncbi:ribosomal-processing cysteine protease Prp [Falsibacillus albus]|uniref:Ribosomal processing cysteine protease Prp n=1 Tax=Falsibacillus albus TaxID=2478915 RepID=A0A3L7K4W9_9BACI|nr:ribosomal-processing cysteine protease Prp [Falsibacillus albus]RLQ98068.1 ribosomal-processing cysteine protease Prp [Falsibacillus albus]
MIRVNINRASTGRIHSFTMEGHADFAGHGQDIVCAGASAVSFGAINAVLSLTSAEPAIEQSSDGGFLSCTIPDDLPDEVDNQVQLLMKGMVVSLQTIERDYGKYIKITFN